MPWFDHRRQTATLWRVLSYNSSGDPVFDTPEVIQVRWDDKMEIYIDATGQERRSRSVVDVPSDLKVNDRLYLGVSTEPDPLNVTDSFPVVAFNKSHTVDAKIAVRRAYL